MKGSGGLLLSVKLWVSVYCVIHMTRRSVLYMQAYTPHSGSSSLNVYRVVSAPRRLAVSM